MTELNTVLHQHIAYAYAHAPAIKDRMDQAGVKPDDIQTVADLSKIPIITKDAFQKLQQENPPFGGFLAVPLQALRRIYLSPGPIYDPQGKANETGLSTLKQMFAEAGFTEGDIVVNTFLYHITPAGLVFDEGIQQVGATVVPMGPGNIELQIKVIMDLKITGYIGVPSFLEMIYDKAAEMGIPPQAIPLKRAFFTAEPYFKAQREKFEKNFGLVTTQALSTADLGIIGYERPGQSGLYIPGNLIVQICDPETGQELPHGQLGEIVGTTLNPVYPLIRFGTGDLSIMEMEGDTAKLLGWMGRSGEAVKVRGMFLHPNSIRAALAPFANITQWQAVVGREGSRDTVTLQLILSNGDVDKTAIAEAVSKSARLTINTVEIVSTIEGSRLIRDTRQFN
jgi:phenylacetate-CoA ligase